MLGSTQIDIETISKVGARTNTEVTVTRTMGPDESTIDTFPLGITSNLLQDWGIQDDKIEDGLKPLIEEMYDGSIGLRLSSLTYGYWFDQFNSESTIHETVNKMRNESRTWFLQNPAEEDQISAIYGGSTLTDLEQADERFAQKISQHLLHAPDRAFVRSEAVHDLSTPPTDDQDFINKIAILGVIIDNFGIRLPGEAKDTGSLAALTNWLAAKIGQDEAQRLTEAFTRIRALRNQYPLHDRYARVSNSQAVERNGVKAAAQFFGFLDHDDCTAKWKKVCDRFKQTIGELEQTALN